MPASDKPEAEVVEVVAPVADAIPPGHVLVTITKAGHGKVHTGGPPIKAGASYVGGEGINLFPTHNWKDVVALPRETATALEARHFVEIDE